MRTFNGLQIFTQQLTNSGQLDARYVRITGNVDIPLLDSGIRVGSNSIPTGESYPGYSGQLSWDQNKLYICVSGDGSQGLWKALPLWSVNL